MLVIREKSDRYCILTISVIFQITSRPDLFLDLVLILTNAITISRRHPGRSVTLM